MATRFAPLFDFDPFTPSRPASPPAGAAPMDAVRTGDAIELRFDLPGFDPASVDLSVEKHVLTLTAQRNWEIADDASVLVRERRHGSVKRQIRLSESLDTGNVEARFDNGVLSVRIPVAETAQPRKVDIAIGSGELVEAAALDEGSAN